MSQKKIIFLIVVGIVVLVVAISALVLSKSNKTNNTIPPVLKIWIKEWTTESYEWLKEWFKAYAPEYAKMEIIFEKKTTDPLRYRTLLLSTMTDETGPDIFMLSAWEDSVLEWKIDPIPAALVPLDDFEKKYDDIFLPLLSFTGSKENPDVSLIGVPLWFETLGVFYNKGLLRESPKTWNAIESVYRDSSNGIYPTNLGLGPKYTPNAADVLGLFSWQDGNTDYENLSKGEKTLERYLWYANLEVGSTAESDIFTAKNTLGGEKAILEEEKLTTYDLFMQGKIAMIIGYPSTVLELEKSAKRVWDTNVSSLILTEKIPYKNEDDKKNLARFSYFALSKFSKNSYAWAKFLAYLMTEDAQRRFLEKNNHLIGAQRSFWDAQKNSRLSDVLSRTKIDTFIPETSEKIFLFNFGLKPEFESFLSESLDRNSNTDIGNISSFISTWVSCSISTYLGQEVSPECEKK